MQDLNISTEELDKILGGLKEARGEELFYKIIEVVKHTGVVIGVPNG